MLLNQLEVTNWRGLQSFSLQFGEGITIIGGPNESGKTSLRSALYAALLLTGIRTEKKALEAARPWETRLCPGVKLDFQVDGKPCRVEKQFLRAGKDWASLICNGRLLAQDNEVQNKLLELLGPASEWIGVLWGEQGEMGLNYSMPESVKGRLAAAAEATVLPEVTRLHELIMDEYTQYWTDKTARPKTKVTAARQLTLAAEDELEEAKQALEFANKRSEDLNVRCAQLESAKTKQAALEQQLQKGQDALSAWESYARATSEAGAAELDLKTTSEWLQIWTTRVQRIIELYPRCLEWKQQVDKLQPQLATPSRSEIEALRARKTYLELALNRERYQAAEAIEVPTPAELKALKDSEDRLRDINARLSVGALQARLTAERELKISLARDDGAAEERLIESSRTESWKAEHGFALSIPGILKLEVDSGNPAIKSDMDQRAELQERLAGALRIWKAGSVADLQQRAGEKSAQLKQLENVDPRQVSAARALVPDADVLDEFSPEQREQLLSALPAALMVAETTWKAANSSREKALAELQKLNQSNPENELSFLLPELKKHFQTAKFEKASGLTIPEKLSEEWLESLKQMDAPWKAELQNKQARSVELKSKAVRPEGTEVTRDGLKKLQEDKTLSSAYIQQLEASINQDIGEIKAQSDLYARLVKAEENHARCEADRIRMDRDAMAIREIHEAFLQARKQLQEDVVKPLQDRVSQCFVTMTSGLYHGVAFDESLKLSQVASVGTTGKVSVNELSFGTREQLSLMSRLCLAELLATGKERQTVILDDNLVHTDNSRMNCACELLEHAARTVQIVVFTCHPERYATIKGARRVPMELPSRLVGKP